MQILRKHRIRSNLRAPSLRRLRRALFGVPALVVARRAEAFEAAYALARERPALAADLHAGLRAGLRDERTARRYVSQSTADGGRAER